MRRRPALFGSLAAVIAVAAAVFLLLARRPAREPDPDPLAPHAYVVRALALIRANAVYAPALDWPALSAEVHQRTGPATTAKRRTREFGTRSSAPLGGRPARRQALRPPPR